MNYYEHHIGDYDANTSHLSWAEDMAYTRLIRWYYRKEKPIPVDLSEACRQIRAVSREQKAAVDAVLKEFFELRDDGWHQDRCDELITAYQAGEPEREAKKANEDNRLKRHREERAELFKVLTEAGQHAAWNIGIKELRELVKPLLATATKPLPATAPATAPATPATATQEPLPITQTPDVYSVAEATAPGGGTADAELTKVELWTAGKSLLAAQGMPKAQCGSFVGKLVKDYGDAAVIEAVRGAVVTRPADAASYIVAACQTHAGQRKTPNKQEALEARNRQVAEEMIAEMAGKVAA
jgi:uncharacterized protein YdaU (DUF1376 family)